MSADNTIRKTSVLAVAVTMSVVVAGCTSSPRYGTDKTANAHLLDGLGSLVSLTPNKKNSEVAYKPRPELVRPPEGAPLPQPQQSLASKENPQWLESPEDTRRRLVAEQDDNTNRFGQAKTVLTSDPSTKEQFEQFRQARANQKGAYEGRRYLSDPPTDYRTPVDSAPTDVLGESEFKKEQRRKAAARKEKGGINLGRLWPF